MIRSFFVFVIIGAYDFISNVLLHDRINHTGPAATCQSEPNLVERMSRVVIARDRELDLAYAGLEVIIVVYGREEQIGC